MGPQQLQVGTQHATKTYGILPKRFETTVLRL